MDVLDGVKKVLGTDLHFSCTDEAVFVQDTLNAMLCTIMEVRESHKAVILYSTDVLRDEPEKYSMDELIKAGKLAPAEKKPRRTGRKTDSGEVPPEVAEMLKALGLS